jgi:hypothetical protein
VGSQAISTSSYEQIHLSSDNVCMIFTYLSIFYDGTLLQEGDWWYNVYIDDSSVS